MGRRTCSSTRSAVRVGHSAARPRLGGVSVSAAGDGDGGDVTEDEALEVLRTHRRRLLGQRCLVCVTTLGLVVLGGWLSTPASWGGNQGPWPIGWALTVAVSIVLIAIVARPTLVSGSRCPQVTTLAPAVVVCSGAGRIAVRPAASSASEGEGDAPARLAWQAISERELPEPGRRVWISATPARGVQSPVVVPPSAGPGRRDGLPATPASPVGSTPGGEERSSLASAYVVWPRDTMEEEGPTRFVVPPADEPGAQCRRPCRCPRSRSSRGANGTGHAVRVSRSPRHRLDRCLPVGSQRGWRSPLDAPDEQRGDRFALHPVGSPAVRSGVGHVESDGPAPRHPRGPHDARDVQPGADACPPARQAGIAAS